MRTCTPNLAKRRVIPILLGPHCTFLRFLSVLYPFLRSKYAVCNFKGSFKGLCSSYCADSADLIVIEVRLMPNSWYMGRGRFRLWVRYIATYPLTDLHYQKNRAEWYISVLGFTQKTGLDPKSKPATPPSRPGSVEKDFKQVHYVCKIKMLPKCIVALIKSFLPKPPVPYVQIPLYFSYDYMKVEDWNDTEDVRNYGDF